jgi:hypothetical protein
MKIIGKIPPELGLYLGTKSSVRPGRFSSSFGFDFGSGSGYGYDFGYGYGSGSGKGFKDIQYEDHR